MTLGFETGLQQINKNLWVNRLFGHRLTVLGARNKLIKRLIIQVASIKKTTNFND